MIALAFGSIIASAFTWVALHGGAHGAPPTSRTVAVDWTLFAIVLLCLCVGSGVTWYVLNRA